MTTTITFDVSNTATDTLGGRTATSNGPSFSTANTNIDTLHKATVAQFDKSKGVLTGATLNLESIYKQTTRVTVAKGGDATDTGTFTAKGTGSSTVAPGIQTGVTGASASLGPVEDSCSAGKIKLQSTALPIPTS